MAPEPPKAQTKHKTAPHVVSHHRLGDLPLELFDKIMFEIDTVRDLAQFIATARFVYQRFRVQRRAVLFQVLHNELGPVLADAMFLFLYPFSNSRDDVQHLERLHVMAKIYHDMLQGGAEGGISLQADALPQLEELKGLCRTLRQINLVADMYVTARFAPFDHGDGGETPATAPLSLSERQRVVRILYRRQMLRKVKLAREDSRDFIREEILTLRAKIRGTSSGRK